MQIILSILIALFFLVSRVEAISLKGDGDKDEKSVSTQQEIGKSEKKTTEEAQSQKKSMEKKKTKGIKKSDTESKGYEQKMSETIKDIISAKNDRGMDVTLDIQALFSGYIVELEHKKDPFQKCKILTQPKLPVDFGIAALAPEGGSGIDPILARHIQNRAKFGQTTEGYADTLMLKTYKNCLADYGAIIAEAYYNLLENLERINIKVEKNKDAVITDIGYDDLILLSKDALNKAIQEKKNINIRNIYKRVTTDMSACRFAGTEDKIQCGEVYMALTLNPELAIGSLKLYGDKMFGLNANFKVSQGFSLNSALEKAKQDSRFKKYVQDISRYADQAESQGKTIEAVKARKQAVENILSGKVKNKLN